MPTSTLTQLQARRALLAHQGLWHQELRGKMGVLDYIRRVGCIQFDPLDIVSRNAELTLQARIPDFRPAMLQELLYQDRLLLDGWDKNMSIYSLEDWPYFRRTREAARRNPGKSPEAVEMALAEVRHAIETRGPLSSIDLHLGQTVDWSWAPTSLARAALESMYFWGELVIHHKVNTRKVYNFAHRHLPKELLAAPDPNSTEEQHQDWSVLRRIGSIGLLWNRPGDAWLGLSGIKSQQRNAAFARLFEQEKISEVHVEGLEYPLYMRSQDRPHLDTTLTSDSLPPRAAILAPLDNLLWDRRLIKELFDFDYKWEVYKPVEERRFGYYVLPILYGDRFIARFEPGRDKKNNTLTIKNWWWEPGILPSQEMQSSLIHCFERFLNYLSAHTLQIERQAAEQSGLDWLTASANY